MYTYSYAKINLGLNVVERRADGYHNIQTVFYPIPLSDVLEIKPSKYNDKPYNLQIVGSPIDGDTEDNLIIKVLNNIKTDFEIPPLDIYLNKRIPIGAGLGGGSSNAACMINLLNDMFSLNISEKEREERVSSLGADCAFFVKSKPVYATGIGSTMSPIDLSLKGWYFILIKPLISVSTREAYSNIKPAYPEFKLQDSIKKPVEEWNGLVKNDFEASVFPLYPEIAAIKNTLYDMGATYASMSGSGSSVFGLFKHPQESLENIFTDCFVFQEKLLR
ncbi:MAG: 4-(cytidine 5'-diphospho)-2-C-methyl-D-erythritol kinase [Bacteroidaceae bacterium]|nr:4-(cytidine 5'-diphospho)-2-C-methyl-D-erythritol kinase [Bacteroidaceae bacterium]